MAEQFLQFVASVMGVSTTDIDLDTTYKAFQKWDSLMMLTLIMELEGHYGVSISMEQIEGISSLGDLYTLVCPKG